LRRLPRSYDIASLVPIALRLSVRDSARGQFWLFIHCVLAEHRDKFIQGITLAAMGYHFRKAHRTSLQVDTVSGLRIFSSLAPEEFRFICFSFSEILICE